MTKGSAPPSASLHATAVAIGDHGVLLLGPSGVGKSDLALRLIDRGAQLVADDRPLIEPRGDRLFAMAAPAIAGLLEIREIGLVAMPFLPETEVALAVTLGKTEDERLPLAMESLMIATIAVPHIRLDPRAASAAIRVEWALRHRLAAAEGSGAGWT